MEANVWTVATAVLSVGGAIFGSYLANAKAAARFEGGIEEWKAAVEKTQTQDRRDFDGLRAEHEETRVRLGRVEESKNSTDEKLVRITGEQKDQWEGINSLRKESGKTNERVAAVEAVCKARYHAKGAGL